MCFIFNNKMAASFNPVAELRFQAQWKEMEKKTINLRMKWFEKNYERVYLNPSLPQDKVPKKSAKLYEELIKMRKECFKEDRKERIKHQRHKEVLPVQPVIEDERFYDDLVSKGPMYPVDPDIKDKLYQGISHNDEGRKNYLKLRNKISPEEKFYEPVTATHMLGWKVAERFFPCKRYGRRAVIKDSFTRRNGVLKFDSQLWRPASSANATCALVN